MKIKALSSHSGGMNERGRKIEKCLLSKDRNVSQAHIFLIYPLDSHPPQSLLLLFWIRTHPSQSNPLTTQTSPKHFQRYFQSLYGVFPLPIEHPIKKYLHPCKTPDCPISLGFSFGQGGILVSHIPIKCSLFMSFFSYRFRARQFFLRCRSYRLEKEIGLSEKTKRSDESCLLIATVSHYVWNILAHYCGCGCIYITHSRSFRFFRCLSSSISISFFFHIKLKHADVKKIHLVDFRGYERERNQHEKKEREGEENCRDMWKSYLN